MTWKNKLATVASLFRKKNYEEEFQEGVAMAKELAAMGLSDENVKGNWECACEDEAFADSPAFARGFKSVWRKHWESVR